MPVQDALLSQEMQIANTIAAAPGRAANQVENAAKSAVNTAKSGYKTFCFLHDKIPKCLEMLNGKQPGEQSLAELFGSGAKIESIDINDENIGDFAETAKAHGIHYALHKITVPSEDGEDDKVKYAVFFKAKQAEVLHAALPEYAKNVELKAQHKDILELAAQRAEEINALRGRGFTEKLLEKDVGEMVL